MKKLIITQLSEKAQLGVVRYLLFVNRILLSRYYWLFKS
jgi:hypothetical protein